MTQRRQLDRSVTQVEGAVDRPDILQTLDPTTRTSHERQGQLLVQAGERTPSCDPIEQPPEDGSWDTVTVESEGYRSLTQYSMAVRSDGVVVLAYTNSDPAEAVIARYDGSTLTKTVVAQAEGSMSFPAVALDAGDRAYMVWSERNDDFGGGGTTDNPGMRLAWEGEDAWVLQQVSSTTYGYEDNAIRVDSSGRLQIIGEGGTSNGDLHYFVATRVSAE